MPATTGSPAGSCHVPLTGWGLSSRYRRKVLRGRVIARPTRQPKQTRVCLAAAPWHEEGSLSLPRLVPPFTVTGILAPVVPF